MIHLHALALAFSCALAQPAEVTVTRDDTVITRSCRVKIPEGTVIADAKGDGVIRIGAEGITVEFAPGSVLRGAPADTAPDVLTGIGIRLDGHKGVTIRGARVSGFKVGIYATEAPGLVIDGADIAGNYRQRLKSTPAAEDGADWLFPHHNDNHEWMTNHGAALVVERSDGVDIHGVKVRQGQNGIILDRVNDSRIYDNDASFLSGWGLAMWRSSRNTVSRNAFDFCIRGYSHGVYNRGQDSAGVLFFEQNSDNVIAENSATHGGDGFFAFAGVEALGGDGMTPEQAALDRKDRGNCRNLLVNNDFSYAAAHGIELTFSFDNRLVGNRLVSNAICGVWGGYSQRTLIAGNTIEANGEMAYGLERGGINIEHGLGNQVLNNAFRKNACGVHLWWDSDEGLMKGPWAVANNAGTGPRMLPSAENTIAENSFDGDALAVQLRDCDSTTLIRNTMKGVGKELEASGGDPTITDAIAVSWAKPEYNAIGRSRPVGARSALAGRQNIIMTEWGPWDHQAPLVRLVKAGGSSHEYEVHNLALDAVSAVSTRPITSEQTPSPGPGVPSRIRINATSPGVTGYTLVVSDGGARSEVRGVIVNTVWDAAFFPWQGPPGEPLPPADLAAWRALANGPGAVRATPDRLSLKYGFGGPSNAGISDAVTAAKFKGDYFGMIATTTLPLTKGRWRITTDSDDGVRVIADGRTILENWTHHGPTRDSAVLEVPADGPVSLTVEHFEIFGFAVLDVQIEPEP